MGAGPQKDQAMIISLELSVPLPTSLGGERGWKWESTDHAYVGKPHKISVVWGLKAFQLVNTSTYQEGDTPQIHREEAPAFGTLPDLSLCISSSGCSSVSFYHIL